MGCVLNHWAALCLDSQVNTMIYIYLSDTERSRKGFICHVFPEDFLFFFLKQHILISRYSVTSAVTTTSISPVIKWQFCIQASRFSWFFFHCRLLFSSAGHSSPGFLSHLFPPFEVLSWSASGRVQRVVCVRRNGEYGREEFSISCWKFLINFVKSVLSVFPSITEGRNTVHHRQERMLLF